MNPWLLFLEEDYDQPRTESVRHNRGILTDSSLYGVIFQHLPMCYIQKPNVLLRARMNQSYEL